MIRNFTERSANERIFLARIRILRYLVWLPLKPG